MLRTRRRKGNRRVTRKMRGGEIVKVKHSSSKRPTGYSNRNLFKSSKIRNGNQFYSRRNPNSGLPELVRVTKKIELDITKYFRMFKDHKNIDTLQISEDGKGLVMKDADGILQNVSIIYARGHGQILKAINRVNIICPNNIAIIQTGKGDYLDHSVFSDLAPVVFKLLFESNPGTDIANFKNFLKLKSGYSSQYGPDALINSVSYKTPGSHVKNILLTSGPPDDDFFNYRGVFDITGAVVDDTIDYNDVTHKYHRLNLSGKNERSSFITILSQIRDTLGRIAGYEPGGEKINLSRQIKYKNILNLSKRMRGETIDAGITTEEILDELQYDEELGYKDNIIFLIIFACGAWDHTVTSEETRQIKGHESENFGVKGTVEEAEPASPFSLTPGISSRIGLPPTSTTIFSGVTRDPFGGTSIIAEEEDT